MKESSTWGDHITLVAFCEKYQREVYVITTSDSEEYVHHLKPKSARSDAEPLWLALNGKNHYYSAIPIEEEEEEEDTASTVDLEGEGWR